MYLGYSLTDVEWSNEIDSKLYSVTINEMPSPGVEVGNNNKSESQNVNIRCSVLLCHMNKTCDVDVLNAINDSGLIYDGGVVVDHVSLDITFCFWIYQCFFVEVLHCRS